MIGEKMKMLRESILLRIGILLFVLAVSLIAKKQYIDLFVLSVIVLHVYLLVEYEVKP